MFRRWRIIVIKRYRHRLIHHRVHHPVVTVFLPPAESANSIVVVEVRDAALHQHRHDQQQKQKFISHSVVLQRRRSVEAQSTVAGGRLQQIGQRDIGKKKAKKNELVDKFFPTFIAVSTRVLRQLVTLQHFGFRNREEIVQDKVSRIKDSPKQCLTLLSFPQSYPKEEKLLPNISLDP